MAKAAAAAKAKAKAGAGKKPAKPKAAPKAGKAEFTERKAKPRKVEKKAKPKAEVRDEDANEKAGATVAGMSMMRGPAKYGKIQYGKSSKPTYSKGNGRPVGKGLNMMGHPSFINKGKKGGKGKK